MFLGEYNPNITEGSRIALPKKLREQIVSDDIVLAKGFEKCVLLYEKQDWAEKVEKQVENLKDQVKRSDLERYLFTSASEASVDSQGRLVIPTPLKEFAGIKSETAVIGVGDHIEIWDKDTWVSHLEEITNGLSQTNSFK
ncbi:division/cell wall cluster transcriptional repressor MraZ [candidate division WWE3 bacterium RIFOXYC1_FULL_40_10]|nr:MAG: division/cell wall cluster transcriptional repressor MraZ [candidate division WWE3 bacterium RIFOXYB1_FULL_40_22]OGC61793.1 MAG: division/cell wall cluster transcriptional repressor MraZ [candidate division WWE3 bacterium RIFOXYA1_FULL_40_11]OGC66176.1 MAG: division/cell wall cluster transcriptional repressor MraZ [candidate division WWE3 bacterium RIFOXYC1_FULL_40_10]OGC67571.1 MAG: division/cell wall cluster transcriptional repressor MraZ [candidate division WWE3 bacterium RIFOXYC2_FUL